MFGYPAKYNRYEVLNFEQQSNDNSLTACAYIVTTN